jgi:uncharacterized protein (TIGR02246 family)
VTAFTLVSGQNRTMKIDSRRVASKVAAELEAAHSVEDVGCYSSMFSADATWITSRGVLIPGREALEVYLSRVMPGGLAGGSVHYNAVRCAPVGEHGVVVVVDQIYRQADGGVKPGGRHRHTYVITVDAAGTLSIVAGQNTTVVDGA